MKRRELLVVCIYCCSLNYGDCQYGSNDAYNQLRRNVDNDAHDPSPNYMQDYAADYSQQQTKPYQDQQYEKAMPYNFGFNIDDGYGTKLDRQEKGDENGYVKGSYGYMDPNGIYRQVEYTAGPEIGFVARVKSNEPGLRNENPADVIYEVESPPSNLYSKSQQTDTNGYASPAINQIREQPPNNYETQVTERQVGKRYTDNLDSSHAKLKPFLSMIKPQQTRNANDEYYQYSDSVIHANNDMMGYASNPIRRRYIYRKVYI